MSALTRFAERRVVGNVLGAFADGAVLLPIVLLLAEKGLFSPAAMLGGAGLAYIVAASLFRIPMPVQPLKSIAIAALAVGASAAEVRVATALLGLACLVLVAFGAHRWLERVPARIVHQVQVGLAALLLLQAWRALGGVSPPWIALAFVLGVGVLLAPPWRGLPWMGIVAAGAILYGLFGSLAVRGVSVPAPLGAAPAFRGVLVLSLLLPQILLTLSNSVLGTIAAARKYYPEEHERVNARALLLSIGAGNLLAAAVGALPFCHGSGGLTAHFRGGARAWWSGCVIGFFLLALAGVSLASGLAVLRVPVCAVAALLLATGVQHLRLAETTAREAGGRALLGAAFLVALLAQNLLYVLGVAVLWECVLLGWRRLHAAGRSYDPV